MLVFQGPTPKLELGSTMIPLFTARQSLQLSHNNLKSIYNSSEYVTLKNLSFRFWELDLAVIPLEKKKWTEDHTIDIYCFHFHESKVNGRYLTD